MENKPMNNTAQNPKRASSPQAKAARAEMERALSFHFQGNKADALKSLRKALRLDPDLAKEVLPSNLARELTGLPVSEALSSLVDGNSSKTMINMAQRERQQAPVRRRQRTSLVIFAVLFLLFIGLFLWSIWDGTLQKALGLPPVPAQKYTLDGYDYYVSIPRGAAPEGGWPLVVAFHGYGGNAEQMLSLAAPFNDAGAILVAMSPTPGTGLSR
jgi:hypothetical protein